MKTRLAPVTVENFRAMDVDFTGHMDHGIENYWELLLEVATTVGVFVDDQCVFVFGAIPDGTGILNVFFITSVAGQQSLTLKKLISRYVSTVFLLMQGLHPSHFWQAIVNAENPVHIAFVEHFGFQGGYLLPAYTAAGNDVLMYYKNTGGASNGLAS